MDALVVNEKPLKLIRFIQLQDNGQILEFQMEE